MNKERSSHSSCALGNFIYVCGGEYADSIERLAISGNKKISDKK